MSPELLLNILQKHGELFEACVALLAKACTDERAAQVVSSKALGIVLSNVSRHYQHERTMLVVGQFLERCADIHSEYVLTPSPCSLVLYCNFCLYYP